jgi:hypothetical protein
VPSDKYKDAFWFEIFLVLLLYVPIFLLSKYFDLSSFATDATQVGLFCNSVISILGAFLGFIISTVAILSGIMHFRAFQTLTKSGQTRALFKRFSRLIYVTLSGLVLAIAIIFTVNKKTEESFWVLFFIMTFWMISTSRCMLLFEAVIHKHFDTKISPHPGP